MLQRFADLMNGFGSWETFIVLFFVAEPLVALVHELGHGVVAAKRLPGEVVVQVGGPKPLVRTRIGRLDIRIHPLVIPGRAGGHCSYDGTHCTRRDVFWIALAGPAAALLFGAALWDLTRLLELGGPLHTLATLTLFVAVGSSIICLLPLKLTDSRGVTLHTDGAQALAAVAGR
jgi:hypothetical protein